MRRLDYEAIATWRADGDTWLAIAERIGGITGDSLRSLYSRWRRGRETPDASVEASSLEEAIAATGADLDHWQVRTWGRTASGKIRVSFEPTGLAAAAAAAEATALHAQVIEDMRSHAPSYELPPARGGLGGSTPDCPLCRGTGIDYTDQHDQRRCGVCAESTHLLEVAIHDPHFGLLAHGEETGNDQDLRSISSDYRAAVAHLLSYARVYNTTRILYIVGHDLLHINSFQPGGRQGVTRAGTPQDFDGRLGKVKETVRRCVVQGIDQARVIAPVDVVVVPGNHDTDVSYDLAMVLDAWYRRDPQVDIQYSTRANNFYAFGKNTFMLTHGERLRSKRDNLVSVMSTECPSDMWVSSAEGCREIHTGHFHIAQEGGYFPDAALSESRGVRIRSLPGLTGTDAWHYGQGFRHRRAATALVYRHSGGIAGLHEYAPPTNDRAKSW